MSIGDVLNQDDKVDKLTDYQVKDVWVRMTLAKQIARADMEGHDIHRQYQEEGLIMYHGGFVKDTALPAAYGKFSPIYDDCRDVEDDEVIEHLFEYMTEGEDLVKNARGLIKQTLRGCGMFRMKIARKRVQYWMDDE
jgi:hypothetical protein